MNNPYQRQPAGAYKKYLVEALTLIGREVEAKEFRNGNMKLAIANSISGSVKVFNELNKVCVNALNELNESNEGVNYYSWGLTNGQFVVASSNGAYVYDPTDVDSVEFVKQQIALSDNEIIQPFFS